MHQATRAGNVEIAKAILPIDICSHRRCAHCTISWNGRLANFHENRSRCYSHFSALPTSAHTGNVLYFRRQPPGDSERYA